MTRDPPEGSGAGDGGALLEPALTQAEVDGLAGFAELSLPTMSGLRGVADGGEPGRPSLPVLDRAAERFARLAALAVGERLGGNAALTVRPLRSLRFCDYVDGLRQPVETFAFRAESWGGPGLLTLGADCVPLLLDALLGGGGGSRPGRRVSLRPATAIESGILSRFVTLLLEAASAAFSEVRPVAFVLDGPVEKLGAWDGAERHEETLVLALEMALDGRYATFDLALPATMLQGVRHLLAGRFTGEKLGRDDAWAGHLATEMWQAEIEAEAFLHETTVPLGQILALEIGQTLTLDLRPSDLVDLRCGPVLLTRGRMGRANGRIALQVVDPLAPVRLKDGAVPRGRPA